MGFIFPLFLLAGIALIVPILIHLFHLRKYKRVNFSDTRFLRTIQLKTKRQAKLQNIRLLIARLLFLAALIFAFAQPYLGAKENNTSGIQVLYIDNSPSMTLRKGQISLLQTAKEKAALFIENAPPDARFIVMDNSRKNAQRPIPKNEAIAAIKDIKPISIQANIEQILSSLSDYTSPLDVYLFSDMQQNIVNADAKTIQYNNNIQLNFVPVQENNIGNYYIDTAYFTTPNIDINNANPLVVVVKKSGNVSNQSTHLQVKINDQIRSAAEIVLDEQHNMWTDTLSLQFSGSEWQKIELSIQDKHLTLDDTFRISARSAPEHTVLVVTESAVSPYLQTAINSYKGFQLQTTTPNQIATETLSQYSLIILQNIASFSTQLTDVVNKALANGQSVLFFPGKISNTENFNAALSKIAGISFESLDTSKQAVTQIQQSHLLFADVFDNIPENVQLPVSKKRYPIQATLSANQQILMAYRDGKPFIAQYSIAKGKLYICASSLNEESTNFQTSHYFAPLIYKMASQNGNSNIFAQTIGSNQPIWVSDNTQQERNLWQLKGDGYEGIPTQSPSGTGVQINTEKLLLQPGFYSLSRNANTADNKIVAFNIDNKESVLNYFGKSEIEQIMGKDIHWLQQENISTKFQSILGKTNPLWKYFLIASLVFLLIETMLLYKRKTKVVEY